MEFVEMENDFGIIFKNFATIEHNKVYFFKIIFEVPNFPLQEFR